MSIRDLINAHEGTELFCLESPIPGDETPRTVYVSLEVAELVIWGADEDTREGDLAAEARAVLDGFVAGGEATVGERPFDKDSECLMARVHPPDDGFFAFRILDPWPGTRVLGAFSEADVFIALTWNDRDAFENRWDEEISRCQAEWKRLFGDISPVKGGLDACISFSVRGV